jgi:hypothetical protein
MNKRAIDTYTVTQSALALGLSTKRVRQLINEGKLTQIGNNPVTISQIEVLDLKVKRGENGTGTTPQHRTAPNDKLLEAITEMINKANEGTQKALEVATDSAKRNEENLMNQIHKLEAEIESLKKKKKWFK